MKKNYINPTVNIAVIDIKTTLMGNSPLQANNSGSGTDSLTPDSEGEVVGDTKGRGDDYESDGWSDGLW